MGRTARLSDSNSGRYGVSYSWSWLTLVCSTMMLLYQNNVGEFTALDDSSPGERALYVSY